MLAVGDIILALKTTKLAWKARSAEVGGKGERLTVCQSIVAQVVARRVGKIEEQGGDGCRAVRFVAVLCSSQLLERDGHGRKDQEHGGRGCHESPPTTETGHKESKNRRIDETPALVGDVDACLDSALGEVHHLEHEVLIVGEERVARHLREQTEENTDEDTAAVTGSGPHDGPRLLGSLHLQFNGGLDLGHFSLHQERAGISLGVVFGKDGEGLVVFILTDKVSRALGKKTDGLLVSSNVSTG